MISSLLTLGAFLSSLTAGLFAQIPYPWLGGRRPALLLACLLTAVGCAIQIGTTDKGVVYLGRLVLGIGNGFLVTFSNIYTAEASPAHLRAVMVALFSEWVNIGSIIGAVVTNATQARLDKASYQIPIGILFVVPVLLGISLWFVPESPRYLVHRGRLPEARAALETLRGASIDGNEALALEWVEMVKGIEEEKKLATTVGPLDQYRGPERRRTLLCYAVILSQVGSGSWFVISYSTYFLIVAGLSTPAAFRYAIMNTCVGLLGVNVGIVLMRHVCGRRTILALGALLQGFCMLGLAIGAGGQVTPVGSTTANNCVIAFLALYQFCYNAFVGVASYPVSTELVSTRLRSWTVGSAISLGYFFAWLTGFCSPYFINPEYLNWVSLFLPPPPLLSLPLLLLLISLTSKTLICRLLCDSTGLQIRLPLGRLQLPLRNILLLLHARAQRPVPRGNRRIVRPPRAGVEIQVVPDDHPGGSLGRGSQTGREEDAGFQGGRYRACGLGRESFFIFFYIFFYAFLCRKQERKNKIIFTYSISVALNLTRERGRSLVDE